MKDNTNAAAWSDDANSPNAGPELTAQRYGWLLASAFWIPAWNFSSHAAHLPFYFWLVDAIRPRLLVDLVRGRPDDYLALCQAVEQLNYGAACFGLAGVFDKRDLESDPASPCAHHGAQFDSISHLRDDPGQIFDAVGARTIDLLRIDGRETSKEFGLEPRQWLARLSPRGVVMILHPEHLAPSWQKVLKKRRSFTLPGKPNIELVAAAGTYPPQLFPAFEDDGDPIVTTMRATFEHLGSTLRARALHRDAAAFASSVETSLAYQSAATDLLRAEKTELEETIERQTLDSVRKEGRISTLEQYVEQFRAEVLRLQEYAIKTQSEIEKVQGFIGDRDREAERLHLVIADRDAEIGRISNHTHRVRAENAKRLSALDDKIQEGEDQILHLSSLVREGETEIARLNHQREQQILHYSNLVSQGENENARLNGLVVDSERENARLNGLVVDSEREIARLNGLVVDSEREIARLNRLIADNENESARTVNLLFAEAESQLARLNEIIADRGEELRAANERAAMQREQAASREAELDAAVSQSESRVNVLQTRVVDLENTLHHITQSTAWRMTSPFRLFFRRFPRSARVLRRTIKLVWWTLSFRLLSRLKQVRRRRLQPALPATLPPDSDDDRPPPPFDATSPAITRDDAGPVIVVSEAAPDPEPSKPARELEPTPDRPARPFVWGADTLLQGASEASGVPGQPSKSGDSPEAAFNRSGEDAESHTTVGHVPDRPPCASTLIAVPQNIDETAPPPSASTAIETVYERIHNFEDRVNELTSRISSLAVPTPQPHIVERVDEVHQLALGLQREWARIQHVETRVHQLASAVELERHRTDYALLGVDGMLNEIELYHDARAKPEYNRVFEQHAPLVSVCVSTMNRSDILVERCLHSLINQTHRNLQIVVVGDHCTDDTGSRIARLRDDRISFHNLSSRGPYPPPGRDRWMVAGTNAINAAISLCEGEFITHLDDDDSATIDRIETLVNAAQRHKADFCWHPFWCENKDGTWFVLGDGRFELAQITTGSIFYHRYFKKFPWDVFAYRTREPGDWNRLRKIRSLRPTLHFVDRPLMFHYSEGSQPPFIARHDEMFVE